MVDIEHKGFYIDGNNTVYYKVNSYIPYNIYFMSYPDVDSAKQFIDHYVKHCLEETHIDSKLTKYLNSNICQEIILPECHSPKKLMYSRNIEFQTYVFNDKDIHTLLLNYYPDPTTWFEYDDERNSYVNDIVYMLHKSYMKR